MSLQHLAITAQQNHADSVVMMTHHNANLLSLALPSSSLSIHTASSLASHLTGPSSHLVFLDISSCMLDASGAAALGHALSNNQSLVSLNLAANCIGFKGAKKICQGLSDNITLTELNISGNELDDRTAADLSVLLTENDILYRVDISRNHIGEQGAKELLEVVQDINPTIVDMGVLSSLGRVTIRTRQQLECALSANDVMGVELTVKGAARKVAHVDGSKPMVFTSDFLPWHHDSRSIEKEQQKEKEEFAIVKKREEQTKVIGQQAELLRAQHKQKAAAEAFFKDGGANKFVDTQRDENRTDADFKAKDHKDKLIPNNTKLSDFLIDWEKEVLPAADSDADAFFADRSKPKGEQRGSHSQSKSFFTADRNIKPGSHSSVPNRRPHASAAKSFFQDEEPSSSFFDPTEPSPPAEQFFGPPVQKSKRVVAEVPYEPATSFFGTPSPRSIDVSGVRASKPDDFFSKPAAKPKSTFFQDAAADSMHAPHPRNSDCKHNLAQAPADLREPPKAPSFFDKPLTNRASSSPSRLQDVDVKRDNGRAIKTRPSFFDADDFMVHPKFAYSDKGSKLSDQSISVRSTHLYDDTAVRPAYSEDDEEDAQPFTSVKQNKKSVNFFDSDVQKEINKYTNEFIRDPHVDGKQRNGKTFFGASTGSAFTDDEKSNFFD
eukprot:GILJ01028286.1.p1 GENE.GILJ01028286.1~~GILJ01028286.1.p1  ORF type:complete len:664 (-),score=117.27 GILJ01028286.1:130-2121(-)